MKLTWHPYKYYPYEKELALREIHSLIYPESIEHLKDGLVLINPRKPNKAQELVYFAAINSNDKETLTIQARLERSFQQSRQSTRYSVHGLHEYKGKFNPQIAKALLNILGVSKGSRILDPFCGSGTTLVESVQHGMEAVGLDINPLAVYIANAKIAALRTPASHLRQQLTSLSKSQILTQSIQVSDNERTIYLKNWFTPHILEEIEKLKFIIQEQESSQIFLSIVSNLLRDYSQQDPRDLRIRRRKCELPKKSLLEAFFEAAETFIAKVEYAQNSLSCLSGFGKAFLMDSREITKPMLGKFDFALTSPPYATALPYIDTQRLSIVWLDLTPASEILQLDASLIGSRETRGQSKKKLINELCSNYYNLPAEQAEYCLMLKNALSTSDGFRRQAVPMLLYRYFVDMANSFRSVRNVMKEDSRYALIVGNNHTILGGKRYDIDTPYHLASLSASCGWKVNEITPLQTYQRYGYNIGNAINSEALIILEAK
ncbi:TPA: RNA methylase [Legionella pneumophila]|nr:DNA methyltransferase [Legionella pneumophila subsp. fraseri]HAT1797703.1 RNA methylase [Legionella pneumophila]MDW8963697.1 DNA methyltransferase [Legionella pneumophila subsp. fraseri]MDW9037377.1 DNA methyltransferase [Legionella pneumophila subsp. fraseri]MDW9040433.1 DNA methyltransferase [Legionella pneumophila subsp. fraseri]